MAADCELRYAKLVPTVRYQQFLNALRPSREATNHQFLIGTTGIRNDANLQKKKDGDTV